MSLFPVIELNKYFTKVETWDEQAIARRGEELAERAVSVWPDFAHRDADGNGDSEVLPEQEVQEEVKILIVKVMECFGGQIEHFGKGPRHFYRAGDGKVLNIKYSKRHNDYYWFGLHASLWEEMGKKDVTHMVFILMPNSFATVPVSVLADYIADAGFSPKSDGTVQHYHVLISLEANPELFYHGKTRRIPLLPYLRKFDS